MILYKICFFNWIVMLNTLATFGNFQEKNHLNACGFAREYLRSCSG